MYPSHFSQFYQKSRQERLALLVGMGKLDAADVALLEKTIDPEMTDRAEHFIENVIGCFPLPLGVLPHCTIDDQDYTIPLAVEETSIIAALNKTARWVGEHGHITTSQEGHCIIGQIQCHHVEDTQHFATCISNHRAQWIHAINRDVLPGVVARGGGLRTIELRFVQGSHGNTMGILHLHADTIDAMGANLINQACEYLKPHIVQATQNAVDLCIVSNLTDTMLTHATIVLNNVDEQVGQAIANASDFAWHDPYRACTHNKGILNGIDPILIATGNDWRAVEAGIHAYAHNQGQYRSVANWSYQNATLKGHFKAPLVVGTVGGVTQLHPIAKLAMKLLGAPNAEQLSRLCAAVGLLQNLAALRALVTKGIVSGHMKLHIDNLMIACGAQPHEYEALRERLKERLAFCGKITHLDASEQLKALRTS